MAGSFVSDIAILILLIVVRAFPDWKAHVAEDEILTGKFGQTAKTSPRRAEIIASWHALAAQPPECLQDLNKQWRALSPTPRMRDGLAAVLPFTRIAPRDYLEHYASLAYWTLDEATALLLGLNPEWCDWSQIEKFTAVDATAKSYARVRRSIQRSIEAKKLKPQLRPGPVLRWACSIPLDVSSALKQAVGEVERRRSELATRSDDEPGGVSRKMLLYMLGTSMLVHFPDPDISTKGGWLASKAKPLNIPGGEDTYRKGMRECADALEDLPDQSG